MEFNTKYTLGDGTVKDYLEANALKSSFDFDSVDPLAPLVVGKLIMLPNTTMAFEEKQVTDEKGAYLFAFLDPQLSGLLEASAAADAYYPKSMFLYKNQGFGLLAGWITTVDMALTPVPKAEQPLPIDLPPTPGVTDPIESDPTTLVVPTGWLETFEAAATDPGDPSLFTAAQGPWKIEGVATGETVKWQWLLDPEKVGPAQGGAQGGVSYPLTNSADGAAGNSPDGAMLLPAYDGKGVAWFGNPGTAIFNDNPSNFSSGAKAGSLTSPVIDLKGYSFATLDFASWFEVESVDVAKWQFDQMTVEVAVVADVYPVTAGDATFEKADDWKVITFMNPDAEAANQSSNINFSSGGNDAAPIWVKKQVNLNQFVNQMTSTGMNGTQKVKLRFNFNSVDSLYNGWRGWGLDNVAILNLNIGPTSTAVDAVDGQGSILAKKASSRKP